MEKIKDITFHYTREEMVKDLIALTPLNGSVLGRTRFGSTICREKNMNVK
jgi:hypothetical protein